MSAKGMLASNSGSICQQPSRKSSRQSLSLRAERSAVEKNTASQIADSAPADFHPVARQFALEVADAPGDLPADEAIAAQSLCPVRHEYALRHPGRRILGNANARREVAGHVIDAV